MKEDFGSFIADTISKMDKSLVMLLLPVAIVIYVCFFMSNDEVEAFFGLDEQKKEYIIKCPDCNKSYKLFFNETTNEYDLELIDDSVIKMPNIK